MDVTSEENYTFLPVEEAERPGAGFFRHYVSAWWMVHPDKGLVFWNPGRGGKRRHPGLGSPQCNPDEGIARRVSSATALSHELRLIESAWVPVDPSDYGSP